MYIWWFVVIMVVIICKCNFIFMRIIYNIRLINGYKIWKEKGILDYYIFCNVFFFIIYILFIELGKIFCCGYLRNKSVVIWFMNCKCYYFCVLLILKLKVRWLLLVLIFVM